MGGGSNWGALGGHAFVRVCVEQLVESERERVRRSAASAPGAWPVAPEPYGGQRNRPMTLSEAADHLRISTRQLHRLRRHGLIRDCRRLGKRGTVNRSDVLKIASASPRKGA
jgi:hypothetical protein